MLIGTCLIIGIRVKHDSLSNSPPQIDGGEVTPNLFLRKLNPE